MVTFLCKNFFLLKLNSSHVISEEFSLSQISVLNFFFAVVKMENIVEQQRSHGQISWYGTQSWHELANQKHIYFLLNMTTQGLKEVSKSGNWIRYFFFVLEKKLFFSDWYLWRFFSEWVSAGNLNLTTWENYFVKKVSEILKSFSRAI